MYNPEIFAALLMEGKLSTYKVEVVDSAPEAYTPSYAPKDSVSLAKQVFESTFNTTFEGYFKITQHSGPKGASLWQNNWGLALTLAIMSSKGLIHRDDKILAFGGVSPSMQGGLKPSLGVVAVVQQMEAVGFNLLYARLFEELVPVRPFVLNIESLQDACVGGLPRESSAVSALVTPRISSDKYRPNAPVRRDHRVAAEVVAVTRQKMLITGAPGSWRVGFSRYIGVIVPELTDSQAWEKYKFYELSGLRASLDRTPPFRAPHHSVSHSGLFGRRYSAHLGEMVLGQNGVIVLNDFVYMSREVFNAALYSKEIHGIAKTSLIIGIRCACSCCGAGSCTCSQKDSFAFSNLTRDMGRAFDLHYSIRKKISSSPISPEDLADVRARVTSSRSLYDSWLLSLDYEPTPRECVEKALVFLGHKQGDALSFSWPENTP